ncbi:MAG: hypothetical protein E7583_03310 [Ruminococcaceae bacterium]|nr:hypothetical protein [Oscillospiraceae bacterium]
MLNYVILISVLFTSTVQGIFAKEYFVKGKNTSPVLFSFVTVVMALLYFVITGIGKLDFTPIMEYLPYSAAFALCYGLTTWGSKSALKYGPMALGTLFGACSLLIPTFLGIFILGDPMLPPQRIVGLVVLFASIAIANLKKEDQRITFLWIVFVVLSVAGNGFCAFTQAAQVKFQQGKYGNEFMITALAFVAIALGIAAFAGRSRETIKAQTSEKHLWIFAILSGLANGFTNQMVMLLVANKMPQSIIQPTVSAGGLVLTLLAAVLLYKEKQSKAKYAAFAFGAVSLVLLNI